MQPKIVTKGLHSFFAQNHTLSHNIVKVYECVIDVQRYSEFIPGIKRSRIISSTPVSENPTSIIAGSSYFPQVMFAELQIDIVAVQLKYMSRVISTPHQSVEAKCLSSPIFKNLYTRWTFAPLSENETMVEFSVEFEFKNSVYAAALYPIFSKMTQLTMRSFEKRLDGTMQ